MLSVQKSMCEVLLLVGCIKTTTTIIIIIIIPSCVINLMKFSQYLHFTFFSFYAFNILVHFLYSEVQSSSPYAHVKYVPDQPLRNMNGYAFPSVSGCQPPARLHEPEVEIIASHIQSIWATCKFPEIASHLIIIICFLTIVCNCSLLQGNRVKF